MAPGAQIDRHRLGRLFAREMARFADEHPRSRALAQDAREHLAGGVPMPWMVRWAGGSPLFVSRASGARFVDVDGREYVDFCLGDTGAMTGHAPAAAVAAIRDQLASGLTFMLPTADALPVAAELARRFGLPYWQIATTATDANRFALRLCRRITGRSKILIFNWCYHGTVDETFAVLERGRVVPRPGNLGPPVDPALTTRVVEWNDAGALDRELAHGDVACVLAEPALTNVGIVLPAPGFHAHLRAATRRAGTLLILDETHTLSAGPGGCTLRDGLEPDIVTVGKPLASGLAAAAYGLSSDVAARVEAAIRVDESDTGGIGGTLAGNALVLAAMRATLEQVLTAEAYESMFDLAERFEAGVRTTITDSRLPWTVQRLGARVEYSFRELPARNGGEAAASADLELDRYLHLAALNRGVLMTPFHNMALMSPATTVEDVDRHTHAFREAVTALLAEAA
jgi:glutamate-1-semialdehyde 2,1-aminomutase